MKNRIDIEHGRYWDRAWSLVDGCTPCSPGCDHCWALAIESRFKRCPHCGATKRRCDEHKAKGAVACCPDCNHSGKITARPDLLSTPLKVRTPTVFSIWNDLFHEAVPDEFITRALCNMRVCNETAPAKGHTFLILTKREQRMADYFKTKWSGCSFDDYPIWFGLTVCNQEEADAKIPIFLQVPGKKFLSIEPMLGPVDLWAINDGSWWDKEGATRYNALTGTAWWGNNGDHGLGGGPKIDAVILGGETGPGARPLHPDWVRSVRDQCAAAGVPFYFKQWGEWAPARFEKAAGCINHTNGHYWFEFDTDCGNMMKKLGRKKAGRLLDGRTHDDLAWGVQ